MDSSLQRRAISIKSKARRVATPQERAEAARKRILKASENLPGVFSDYVSERPISAAAFALLGGFIVGYFPGADRVLIKNIDGLLRFLYNLRR